MKSKILRISVKGQYFKEMAAGEKPWEYRLITPYWNTRLVGRTYHSITVCWGFPKKDDASRHLHFKWNGYKILKEFQHDEFGPKKLMVFAINVSERLSWEKKQHATTYSRTHATRVARSINRLKPCNWERVNTRRRWGIIAMSFVTSGDITIPIRIQAGSLNISGASNEMPILWIYTEWRNVNELAIFQHDQAWQPMRGPEVCRPGDKRNGKFVQRQFDQRWGRINVR